MGDGPLESWARENAPPNVRLLGRLPRAELYALLGESRAALAPSLCYESFALVPAEAHAMGTPVLASDLGNVGAMVRPGVDGLRFAPATRPRWPPLCARCRSWNKAPTRPPCAPKRWNNTAKNKTTAS